MSEETNTATLTELDPAAVKAEMLKIYPAKTAKKRAKGQLRQGQDAQGGRQ